MIATIQPRLETGSSEISRWPFRALRQKMPSRLKRSERETFRDLRVWRRFC